MSSNDNNKGYSGRRGSSEDTRFQTMSKLIMGPWLAQQKEFAESSATFSSQTDVSVLVSPSSTPNPAKESIVKSHMAYHQREIEKSERDYCGYSSFAGCLMLWEIPVIHWRFFPLFLLMATILVIGVIMRALFPDHELWDAKVYLWMLWLDVAILELLVIHFLVKAIILLLKRIFLFSKITYYINKQGFNVSTTIWSCINLGVFYIVIQEKITEKSFWWISRILFSIFVVSLAMCIALIIDKILNSYIQRKQFWTNILDYMFKEKVVYVLLGPPVKAHLIRDPDRTDSRDKRRNLEKDLDKAWNFLKSSIDYDDLEQKFDKQATLEQASAIAADIMKNVDHGNKGHLEIHDFDKFFKKQEDTTKAWLLFDKTNKGQIAEEELVKTLYNMLKDRRELFVMINDRESIGSIISNTVHVIVAIIVIFIIFAIFKVDISGLLLPFGTFILAFAFIFGNTLKNLFEAFLLIFVIRPYEVGDRINIPNFSQDTLVVHRINLLTTEAFATDGPLHVIPNNYILNQPIRQYKRSRDYAVYLKFDINSSTTKEQISKLKEHLWAWVEKDGEVWKPNPMVWLSQFGQGPGPSFVGTMTVNVWAELSGINWSAPVLYLEPRGRMVAAVAEICTKLNIDYWNYYTPVGLKKEN
eukprot:CAMPEP_0168555258 /NCGR_PEP_ID=MMETSP0413-20121227/8234_1 /TAXON_ID=136452 /ORGANISM="Filamoeba nolandi, Strain NC-AS-23-1" /LENGTH=640 /DNA_ID=CAMNT_0008586087 /DNA_START=193 /DNA_END=2115 /DNA_ORIENTATION=-